MSLLAMEFDLVGVDASIANALRRIMISEVNQLPDQSFFVKNI